MRRVFQERGKSMYKGPEAGRNLACLRIRKRADMAQNNGGRYRT